MLKTTLKDIFETNSDLAKKIKREKENIEKGLKIIKSIDNDTEEEIRDKILELLKIFYKGAALDRQVSRLDKCTQPHSKLALGYNILAARKDRLQKMEEEMEEFTKGNV